jgi:hypothetical protein
MRLSLSFKTLSRAFAKSALILLLLTASTFALFSRVIEFSVTARDFGLVKKSIKGVIMMESEPAVFTDLSTPEYLTGTWYNPDSPDGTWEDTRYAALTAEELETAASLPYVSRVSTRYMTAGVSDSFRRTDETMGLYDYTDRYVIQGSLWMYDYLLNNQVAAVLYENGMFAQCPVRAVFSGCFPLTAEEFLPAPKDGTPINAAWTHLFHIVDKDALQDGMYSRVHDTGQFSVRSLSSPNEFLYKNTFDTFYDHLGDRLTVSTTSETGFPRGYEINTRYDDGGAFLVVSGHLDYLWNSLNAVFKLRPALYRHKYRH